MPKPAPKKTVKKQTATKKAVTKKAAAVPLPRGEKGEGWASNAARERRARAAPTPPPPHAGEELVGIAAGSSRGGRSDGEPRHFLIKSEPYVFSFEQLRRDGRAVWDGVRSFEARNNLRAMQPGDRLLFYHSNEGKEIVGVAVVSRSAYPDPSAPGEDWSAVDIAPLCGLSRPVTLAAVKAEPRLADFALVRKSRVSVVPVTPTEFAQILTMAKTKLPTTNSAGRELRTP